MKDRRKTGRRETDRLSEQEAAERAGEALDRIALIAMEQGSITKMKEYISSVDRVESTVSALTSELLAALERQEYESAQHLAEEIGRAAGGLKDLEKRIFDGDKYR